MREYVVREYEKSDIDALDNMSVDEVISVLDTIACGWLPPNYVCGADEGDTFSEDQYEATRLHNAVRKAIEIIRGVRDKGLSRTQ